MTGGISGAAPTLSWRDGNEGCSTAAFSRRYRRMRSDEAKGRVPNGAIRTVRSKTATLGTTRKVMAESARGRRPNEPPHVTAARLRFLLNLNGHCRAAALERGR